MIMCGIVGYTGDRSCLPVLLEGLGMLEYRGYDSAGISLAYERDMRTVKSKGKLSELEKKLAEYTKMYGRFSYPPKKEEEKQELEK